MCNFFVSNHFAAINRASEPQSEEWFGGGFHLWQTVKLFLLSIQIHINCNVYSLDFLFHDTGIFESAVKRRLKQIMYYTLPHSQDFLDRGKSSAGFAVFSRYFVSPYFWWLSLPDVSRNEFRKWDFLNIYILNLPQSPLLIQWSVGFGWLVGLWFLLVCLFSCRVHNFSNSTQVLKIFDNSPNAGAQFSSTPFFN